MASNQMRACVDPFRRRLGVCGRMRDFPPFVRGETRGLNCRARSAVPPCRIGAPCLLQSSGRPRYQRGKLLSACLSTAPQPKCCRFRRVCVPCVLVHESASCGPQVIQDTRERSGAASTTGATRWRSPCGWWSQRRVCRRRSSSTESGCSQTIFPKKFRQGRFLRG